MQSNNNSKHLTVLIIANCSHCDAPSEDTDGVCKALSKDDKYCVNKAETSYCSDPKDVWASESSKCESRIEGKFKKNFE